MRRVKFAGQFVEPEAFLDALHNNYYLTHFTSNVHAFDSTVVEICLMRNRQLKEINAAIKRTLSILEAYDEARERVDSLTMLGHICEYVDRKIMFAGQNSLLDWLILAMIDFHYASSDNVVARGRCVLVSLKVVIKSLGIDYDAIPQDFFLKEYVRLLEGNGFALNFESKAAQWSALVCLFQPFKDAELQCSAYRLVMGLLCAGVVNDCQEIEFRRAVDWLLVLAWITNAKVGDRPIVELNAYARLIGAADPALTEKIELSRDYHQCLAEFNALVKSEIAEKALTSGEALWILCCEKIVKTALIMLQDAPASSLKPAALLQPDTAFAKEHIVITPAQTPNHRP